VLIEFFLGHLLLRPGDLGALRSLAGRPGWRLLRLLPDMQVGVSKLAVELLAELPHLRRR
jgi:hypothetical protein